MSTSGTYDFGSNTKLDDLIRDAYERIGIVANSLTALQANSAILSGNLELQAWTGRGLNLWMVEPMMFGVQANRAQYTLPESTVQVLEVVSTIPNLLPTVGIGGSITAAPITGDPYACFFPGNTGGCIMTSVTVPNYPPNPYIGWLFWNNVPDTPGNPPPPSVKYVGFKPFCPLGQPRTYRLQIQVSWDPTDSTFTYYPVYTTELILFLPGETKWFVLPTTISAPSWRIMCLQSLAPDFEFAVQQVYFAEPPSIAGQGDIQLGVLSRSDWMAFGYKNLPSSTTLPAYSYYFNQQQPPTMTLYPVPTLGGLNSILYTNYRGAQDLVALYQNAQVPARFYDALVSGLAARLALKFAPDRLPVLMPQAEQAYRLAGNTDWENVSVFIDPSLNQFGGRS